MSFDLVAWNRTRQARGYFQAHRQGMTVEQLQDLRDQQGGRCAICGRADLPLHIDHDHGHCPGVYSCGECIRGLLCPPCNHGLGKFRDDPRALLAAVAYLQGGYATLRPLSG